jgi:hypothetical protein
MPALLACCLLASFVQLPSLPIEIAPMRAAVSGVFSSSESVRFR